MVKKASATKQATNEEQVPKLVEVTPSMVKEPTPGPVKIIPPVAVVEVSGKPFELGRRFAVGTSCVVGMPKSKKPWKVLSERSSKHTPYNPKKWDQKMNEKKKLQAIRDRVRLDKE